MSTLPNEERRQQIKNNLTSRGRQWDLSKKLRVHCHLPIRKCLLIILRVVRHRIGRGPFLCRVQVMFDYDIQISALDAFYEMDGRKSRYIREVLDWYRGEDAGDLKRSELNELVGNLTCLTVLEVKFWESNQKVVTDEKSWGTGSEQRDECKIVSERRDEWRIREEQRDECPNWSKGCDGSVHIQKLVDGTVCSPAIKNDARICGWQWTVVVDWNSKQRSIPCDTVLGTTLCEFGSAHEEIDVTSWRFHVMVQCVMRQHFAFGCMNIQEDMHRGVEHAPGLTPGAVAAPLVTPSRVSLDDREEMVGSIERVMVDSGAAVSVCPLGNAPGVPVSGHSRHATLRTASGAQVEHAGQKTVEYEYGDGGLVNVNFAFADVTRPLVAVDELQKRGMTVVMGQHGSFVTRGQATNRLASMWTWSIPMALIGCVWEDVRTARVLPLLSTWEMPCPHRKTWVTPVSRGYNRRCKRAQQQASSQRVGESR